MTSAELKLRAAQDALAAAFDMIDKAPTIAGRVVLEPATVFAWSLTHIAAIGEADRAQTPAKAQRL